jgi:poly(beta-D-mannuronate) lyase
MRRSLILALLLAPAAVRAQAQPARRSAPRPMAAPRPLVGPFKPLPDASGPAPACETAPAPVRNLEGLGFYLDPAFSRPDPKRMQADAEAARPLLEWLAAVQSAVERRRKGESGAATCVLAMLDHWARNEALLGAFNREGGYHRKRALAGAALSLLAIRDAPGLDPVRLGRTGRWLGEVARAVRPHYERKSEALISDTRNNEAAWAGLAVAAGGIAAGDRGLLDWGVTRLRAQLAQVDERGALPQEVARKAMALHYHLAALDAVAALERLTAANGIALTDQERTAYRRLRDLCLTAAREPARMAEIAGVEQADPWLGDQSPLRMAPGLEIAAIAMPDPASEEALAPFRPYADPWLGGGITGWWKG